MNAKVQEESTLGDELLEYPLIIATFSALIGVALSQLGSHLYGLWTHSTKRDSILRVLRSQLQNHSQQLSELGDELGATTICGALDPSPVLHFLNGDVVALPKDQKLVTALYKHLDDIEVIRNAMHIISMTAAGWTSVHAGRKEAIEQSLKTHMPSCQTTLDSCLKELQHCITHRPNSIGIVSLILGVLALLICWIPYMAIVSVALSALGLISGIIGIVRAMTRAGYGVGFAIAGSSISAPALIIASVIAFGMFAATSNTAGETEATSGDGTAEIAPSPDE